MQAYVTRGSIEVAGYRIAAINRVMPAAELCDRLIRKCRASCARSTAGF